MNTEVIQRKNIFEGVTGYHWLVVVIASCGWLFDCMDQRLFVLARESALKELLGNDAAALLALKKYIGYATTSMILGWATGGIIFGMMSDKIGRVKTMVATLIVYSGFTGLSGFAQSWVDFTIYRFLVGLGVGGMFGAATTLVAESVPGQFRSVALGSLQALSATGNILGSLISLQIPPGAVNFFGDFAGWRILFFVGILPSLLVIPIMFFLKEPEVWRQAVKSKTTKRKAGSYSELLANPNWHIAAAFAAVAGIGIILVSLVAPDHWPRVPINLVLTLVVVVAGVWTIRGDRSGSLLGTILIVIAMLGIAVLAQQNWPKTELEICLAVMVVLVAGAAFYFHRKPIPQRDTRWRRNTNVGLLLGVSGMIGLWGIGFFSPELISTALKGAPQSTIDNVRGWGTALQDVGAFLGMMTFTLVASYLNRRLAFLGAFILCLATTMFVFNSLNSAADAYWMLPLMGFAQLAVFAGYSIYFPELFPTRLRGTGVGFCYNTVRYLAAPAPILLGYLSTLWSFRTAAMVMSSIYLLGVIALIWAPETKDQPLPEG